MKIAIFHELPKGGARRAVNEFAKKLKKNHFVDLYIVGDIEDQEEKKFFSHMYFNKFKPKVWNGGNWKIKLYKDTIEVYRLYTLHKQIAGTINGKNYDLAFIHPSKFTQAPFILQFIDGKKCYYCQEPLRIIYDPVFNVHPTNKNAIKKVYEKLNRWMRKEIDRKNISYADMILANSINSQKNIKSAYGLKSLVSYLGVDTDIFKPRVIKKDIDILFIGSKEDYDGYALLKEAKELMKSIATIHIHISGKNWIENDNEFAKLYSRSKIVVCLAKNEPFGLTPIEAMASGVPVIAIQEGGYAETVIDNETGYLIQRDPKILAQKLDKLLASPTRLSKMGREGRLNVMRNWTWDKQSKELEEKFYRIVNK